MNRAVLRKTFREYRLLLSATVLGIILLEVFLVRAILDTERDLDKVRPMLELPLVRNLVRLALGADLLEDVSSTALMTFGLGHPLLYALAWTLLLTIATGVIAGEIGRGTADLLLTLPVSRVTVYLSTTVVWVVGAVAAGGAAWLGLWLGQCLFPLSQPLDMGRLALVAINFCALNLAVAGCTMLASSLVSRRGVAVAIILTALLVSDLINFLALFWPAAEAVSCLGFLHYYRPLQIVRSGALSAGDLSTLLGLGAAAWLAGLWYFHRRDIPAA